MNPAAYFLSTVQKNHIPIPITIGTQVWDSINLNTAYYTDGTPIQFGMLSGQTVGGWYWYNNDQSKGLIYGRLYNRWAVEGVDGSGITKTMAPTGWRISTPADWTTLSNYLGGNTVSGGKLKQAGLSLWQSPNTGATNSSVFTALPGGCFRRDTDTYNAINTNIYFRTTDYLTTPILSYNSAALTYSTLTNNNHGFYVRLIKIIPVMTTTAATVGSPSSSTINSGGNITDASGYTITQRGVCWATSANPIKVSGNFTSDGSGIGSFISNITGLNPNTTYYIRAYAVTSLETFYANDVIFITTGTSTITTSAISSIGSVSATSGGTITSSNGNTITQSGICWSTSEMPTIANAKTTDGVNEVTSPPDRSCGLGKMTGLLQSTPYYVRAYVTTTPGDTTYGNQVSFSTIVGDTLRAAYSLRRIVSSYSGAAIRVRGIVSASTIIADVSFNGSGWVDTDSTITIISGTYSGGLTLQAFATLASTVWVQTWYDQSGNAKNVNQTIIGRQPTIAVSGALNRAGVNNKVALKFTRTAQSWMVSAADTSLAMNNTQVYTVCNSDSHTSLTFGQVAVSLNSTSRYFSGVFGIGSGTTAKEWLGYGSSSANYGSLQLRSTTFAASQLFYSISNATGIDGYINNDLTSLATLAQTNSAASQNINIGATGTGSTIHFNGSIQEVQIYTPIGTTNRAEVSNNIVSYYGIPQNAPT